MAQVSKGHKSVPHSHGLQSFQMLHRGSHIRTQDVHKQALKEQSPLPTKNS